MQGMAIQGATGIEPPAKLTDLQNRFIEEFIKLGMKRPGEAAKRAGYSEKSAKNIGPRLVRRKIIAEEVRRRTYAISSATEVTPELLVVGLLEIAQDTASNERARVAAYTQLGRYTGGFEVKRETTHKGALTITRGTPKLSSPAKE